MIEILRYTDYRLYLRDWLEIAKKRKGFSLRRFAARAGLGSPSYLTMVIEGERSLGEFALNRFILGLKLVGEEALYFRSLVLWNQAKSDTERARFEGRLALLRKFGGAKPEAISKIKKTIEGARQEIVHLLTTNFTQEEAVFLARQFLPVSWIAAEKSKQPIEKEQEL